jgi:hypothetical protein
MRSLDLAQVTQLVGLVLGERAAEDLSASLLDQTRGDVRRLLAHLLVIVQEAQLARGKPSGLTNGARSGSRHPVLRLEGDHWVITFAGHTIHLRDARGLRYLAPLLDRPGEAVHVLDLMRQSGGRSRAVTDPERARQTVTKCVGLTLRKIDACHPDLAAHLRASIRRGIRCSYVPVWDR